LADRTSGTEASIQMRVHQILELLDKEVETSSDDYSLALIREPAHITCYTI